MDPNGEMRAKTDRLVMLMIADSARVAGPAAAWVVIPALFAATDAAGDACDEEEE